MEELIARVNNNLIGRLHGAMQFRLILQPFMATIQAVRGGWTDAREGRPPYFWAILTTPQHRAELLHEGWKAIARVVILAIFMDAIYQWIELRRFYPGEAVIVAIILAVLPYLLLRGPVSRVVRPFLKCHD